MQNIRKQVIKEWRKTILERQNYKCANYPDAELEGLGFKKCLLWKYQDGSFIDSWCDFDHIIELADGGLHEIDNLQALCPDCHRVKTKIANSRGPFHHDQIGVHKQRFQTRPYIQYINRSELPAYNKSRGSRKRVKIVQTMSVTHFD